jgi:hypothetical protein
VVVGDELHTALFILRPREATGFEPLPEAVYKITEFFQQKRFLVAFQSPNLLVICGGQRALLRALSEFWRGPANGREHIMETTVTVGTWNLQSWPK